MGEVIRGPWRDPKEVKAVIQVAALPALLPDYCCQCGSILGKESPPEGKACPRCGKLHSHASLSADY